MQDHGHRDHAYIDSLRDTIYQQYRLDAIKITPAKRGYYGETWRLKTADKSYFVKLDFLARHQQKFKNSLPVVQYFCENGMDFIPPVVKTCEGELCTFFLSAVLAVFEWVDGQNVETDETKPAEYAMLGKIYPLTKPGFDIPTATFSDALAVAFYEKWSTLKAAPFSETNHAALALLDQQADRLSKCASRLRVFASRCKSDASQFFLTHGDAGGNFFVGEGRNYLVDWDEVMYAPLERDAWVMGCRGWARDLFNDTLRKSGIAYTLRPERLAFYCYHMFFLYLGEFLDDFMVHGRREDLEKYFAGFIIERIGYADTVPDCR